MENRNSNQPPIACDLTVFSLGERERYLALSPGKGTWCAKIAEWVMLERRCCPFLSFELVFEADRGPVELRLRGPQGTKEFIRGELSALGWTP